MHRIFNDGSGGIQNDRISAASVYLIGKILHHDVPCGVCVEFVIAM